MSLPADLRARADALLAEQAARETADAGAPTTPASTSPEPQAPSTREDDDRPRPSQATRLVELAQAAGVELWHTPTGDPYVTIPVSGHREHHPLGSRAAREWLSRLHHVETRRTPGAQAIGDALGTLSGIARYDGAEHDVHVRVAGRDGAVYLDLGDAHWRAIEVTAAGWRVVPTAPIRFRRGRALLPLPEPETGGSVDALRELIHVADDDWRLLVGWLVGALRPTGPYPLLALDGEQGTGKSMTARLLRRLIDPSGAELRAEPREIRDMMIAASGGWAIAFDNLSHLQPWLSDALCRISTGGALSTRQLYSDGDEHIVEAVRPVLITGITSVVTRGDLQDRAIAVTLPAIPEHARRPEAEVWAVYDRIRPGVLGALLDAVSCALRRESQIHLTSLPRMADWAVWVTAAEPALGLRDSAIVGAYARSRQHVTEQTLDGDPLAVGIRALDLPWTGTAAELLRVLTPVGRMPRGWPESPRGLSAALRRLAPQLRRVGVEVDLGRREPHTGRRLIYVGETGAQPSPSSPSSPRPDLRAGSGDGSGDGPGTSSPSVTRPSPVYPLFSGARDGGDGGDGSAPTSSQEEDADGYHV